MLPSFSVSKSNVKRNSSSAPTANDLLTKAEMKESPAILVAKRMEKLDKKKQQIVKIKRQIRKTKVEMADTKQIIRALEVNLGGTLYGDKQGSDDVDAVLDDEEGHENETVKDISACEKQKDELTTSNIEVKGSLVTLAKAMMELDKKGKQLAKLKQQLSKAEREATESQQLIITLSRKYKLNTYLYGDDWIAAETDHIVSNLSENPVDWLAAEAKQSVTALSENYNSYRYGDNDEDQSQSDSDDDSVGDDEEGYDASNPTFKFSSNSLMYLSGFYKGL